MAEKRRRGERRTRTISVRGVRRLPILAPLASGESYPVDAERPKTRGDCVGGVRPCPWVSCRYHLAIDVKENGNLVVNFPGKSIAEMRTTCALDVADRGRARLKDVARIVNVHWERVRQIEISAKDKLRAIIEAEHPELAAHVEETAPDTIPPPPALDEGDAEEDWTDATNVRAGRKGR